MLAANVRDTRGRTPRQYARSAPLAPRTGSAGSRFALMSAARPTGSPFHDLGGPAHGDRAPERRGGRALFLMPGERALDGAARSRRNPEPMDVHLRQHRQAVPQLVPALDLGGDRVVLEPDLPHVQGGLEGPDHSAAGGG